MGSRLFLSSVGILMLWAAATPANAATVEVTSGTASLYWDGSLASFTLLSPDSQLTSEYYGAPLAGFSGGTTVDLSTTIPATNAGNHALLEMFEGHSYQAWVTGSLTISAQPFVPPLANGDGLTFQNFSVPFKMSGTITGYATADRTGAPLFTTTVIGGGTLSADYRIVGNQYVLTGAELLRFAPTSWLPAPWSSSDVGDVGLSGYAYQAVEGALRFGGAGVDIWGTADAFRFVYQQIDGDAAIVGHVLNEDDANAFAKAGVMIRRTLDPGSPHVVLDVKPDGGLEFMARVVPDAETRFLAGGVVPSTPPDSSNVVTIDAYLQLTRTGDTIAASVCRNTCSLIGTTTWPVGPAFIGAAVTSHDQSEINDVDFRALPTVTVDALPAPWTLTDVGAVGLAGVAQQANGVFTLAAAGSDIWGTADSFSVIAQPVTGDGQILARVVSEENTSTFAKAGVTFGGSAASGARVILDVKPDGGIEFMARLADGAAMSFLSGAAATLPVYLRLTRTSDRFDGAISPDGVAWSPVGSVQIELPATVDAGLAVTSHDPSVRSTAEFDHVRATTAAISDGNLIVNGGFEQSSLPAPGPGWVSDSGRGTPAIAEAVHPRSGADNGACVTTQSLDCGLYQDIVVPSAGTYTLTVYSDANREGALVGWNINGSLVASGSIAVGGYLRQTFTHTFSQGDTIRVWMYSPATAGWAVIDDVRLAVQP